MAARDKVEEVISTSLPIIVLVFALYVLLLEPDLNGMGTFLLCALFTIVGFIFFLVGVDLGIMPMGVAMGTEIPKRKSYLFMIVIVFIISFVVTIAEPDVQVFSNLVTSIYTTINGMALTISIALGVGISLIIAAVRILKKASMRVIITVGYSIVIVLALLSPDQFMGIAFDSGGVTTGPMTVPMLLALGMGISFTVANRSELDSFGMIGIASIGPIVAVLVYGLICGASVPTEQIIEYTITEDTGVLTQFKENIVNVLIAVTPLYVLFVLFQRFLLHYSWRDFKIMTLGILIAAIGIVLFLTGVYSGFMPIASDLGEYLILHNSGIWIFVLGAVMGFMVAIAEPAVNILGNQVQSLSKGMFSKSIISTTIATGVALFVGAGFYLLSLESLSMYYLIPFYILAIVMVWFMDKSLIGVAYDAGGVATGPMSVAIIMTLFAGMASAMYTGSEAVVHSFGIVAMIALAPIISLSVLGVIVRLLKRGKGIKEDK